MGQLHSAVTILGMEPLASFSLRIEHVDGGKTLAAKSWNALWDFSLLALACRSPMMSLYSVADGQFTGVDRASLPEAYLFASRLLVGLLRKMVELGRVPEASELDQLAASVEVR